MYKNKTYIVVGGLGLIGSVFVRHILKNNGNVIVADLTNNNHALFKELRKEKNFNFKNCDVNNDKSLDNLISFAIKNSKRIDGAIYCAYPKSKKWGAKFSLIERKYLNIDLNANLGSPIIFSQKIIKLFLAQKKGVLVHISSIQGVSSPKFEHYSGTNMTSPIEYSAIKSGVISITKYLAKLYKKDNIRINCISPGGIYENQPKSFIKKYKKDSGMKGLLDPSDLVGALQFILSDENKFVNGQNIIVDDGWTL
tara:strand:+ start:4426 stop:5184 length:759 start_codon:yes stop_codon:yes gene_type:complete